MFEFRLADVVAFNLRNGSLLAIEVEMTPRNILGNLRRNIRNGFKSILIVTPRSQVESVQRLVDQCPDGAADDLSVHIISDEHLKAYLEILPTD